MSPQLSSTHGRAQGRSRPQQSCPPTDTMPMSHALPYVDESAPSPFMRVNQSGSDPSRGTRTSSVCPVSIRVRNSANPLPHWIASCTRDRTASGSWLSWRAASAREARDVIAKQRFGKFSLMHVMPRCQIFDQPLLSVPVATRTPRSTTQPNGAHSTVVRVHRGSHTAPRSSAHNLSQGPDFFNDSSDAAEPA